MVFLYRPVNESFGLCRVEANLKPTKSAYGFLIRSLAQDKEVGAAVSWMDRMVEEGIDPDLEIYEAVLEAVAKSGRPEMRRDLEQSWIKSLKKDKGIKRVSKEVFKTIIRVAARYGDLSAAAEWLKKMKEAGHQCGVNEYNYLLKGSEYMKDPDSAQKFFNRMEKADVKPDAESYNLIIKTMAKAGKPKLSEKWANKMEEAGLLTSKTLQFDLVAKSIAQNSDIAADDAAQWVKRAVELQKPLSASSYRAVMRAYLNENNASSARQWFEWMEQNGTVADYETYLMLMRYDDRKTAFWHSKMEEAGIAPTTESFNLVIRSFSEVKGNQRMQKAEEWYDRMLSAGVTPDQETYAQLIAASVKSRDDSTDKWFSKMMDSGLSPDSTVYKSLMMRSLIDRDPVGVRQILDWMVLKGISIHRGSYNIAIRAFAEANEPEKAEEIYQRIVLCGIYATSYLHLCTRAAPVRFSSTARPLQLVRDMRHSLYAEREAAFPDKAVAPDVLQDFVRRAKEIDFKDPEAKVAVFYWLSKCSQGTAGSESEELENLLLQFTRDVRKEALYGTETQLVLILRSLIVSTNRQKIQRALETDAQIQMEQLVRELLSVSIPRLKMRHQHLQILQISMCLASYAAMWLPEYREIFDVFAPELVARINRARRTQNLDLETDLGENLPFILASYGKASCMHRVLFDTALSWCEEKIGMISYENLAIVSIATASGCFGDDWSLKAISRVCSSYWRLLFQENFVPPKDTSLQDLFNFGAREMLKRSDELTFHEAADILLILSACAEEDLSCWQDLQRAVSQMTTQFREAPHVYLCRMFYAITAIDLHKSGVDIVTVLVCTLLAQQVVAKELLPVLNVCLAPELEVLVQSLLALSRRATPEHLSSLGFRILLLVSQREAVRKAKDLGPKRAARLSCFLTAAVWPWRSALLQPWFLEEMKSFVSTSDAGFEGIYGHWLQGLQVSDVEHVEPWPEPVAWYLERLLVAGRYPDERTFSFLIEARAQQGSMEKARAWLNEMLKAKIRPGFRCYAALVKGYALKGDVEGTKEPGSPDGFLAKGDIDDICDCN
eukprot:s952_g20.t2